MAALTFKLNDRLYLRDPQHTDLGQRIISSSISLIDELGFEDFTFRKLAQRIDSVEASVYRYFENKHRLLHYLGAWYWSWLAYRIELVTTSLPDPEAKLKAALRVITEPKSEDPDFDFVNEEALHRIVVAEIEKTYLTKWVDNDNQAGLFGGFKELCLTLARHIQGINPNYPYAHSLASTALLASHQQLFFVEHLPSLSDLQRADQGASRHEHLYTFVEGIVTRSLQS